MNDNDNDDNDNDNDDKKQMLKQESNEKKLTDYSPKDQEVIRQFLDDQHLKQILVLILR